MVIEVTYTTAAGPEVEGMPSGAEINSSASPILMLLDVPAIQVDVSLPIRVQGCERAAGIALLAIVAVNGDDVSNTCGDCPGPGTLCTRVPAVIRTVAGEPGAVARENANTVEALTPGEGLYPTRRASSNTLRASMAVPRYASLASRSV